ncbi:MAG: S8 family serine peptidase [Alphaproteobacteria bacterium]|nr:S8 family serine peptidase [Alphaproteobacteria bacterium]
MRPITPFLLPLGLVVVAAVLLGPDGPTRARQQANVQALVAPRVAEDPEPERVVPEAAPGRLVIDLQDGSDDAALAEVSARLGVTAQWLDDATRDEALAVADVEDLAAAAAALDGMTGLEVVEPDLEVEALGWPDDPLYPRQWHLDAMGAPAGWRATPGGKGVIVAVIDTGVTAVADLDPARVLPGRSFVPGASTAADDNGHGTHVAGTIAQTTNNGIGCAGVAPYATILPVKVLSGSGSGSSAQVAAGIDWAVDQGAQVINLSLGSGLYSAVIHVAVRKARRAGVVVVAAAGNDGRERVSWPGALHEVIGVAAVGPDGAPAPYSNRGKGVDIAAPGGDKRTPGGGVLQDTVVPGGGHDYLEFQGTSMATPHVAGAAAVLLSTGILDAAGVETALLVGADGDAWDKALGFGRLDLGSSLAMLGVHEPGARVAMGLMFGVLLSSLSGAGGVFRGVSAAVGAVAAGGVIGAGVLGGTLGALLSRGVLGWPIVFLGPVWAQVLAWGAFVVPLAVAFLLGPTRLLRPVALGICAGVAAALLHGLIAGDFARWWLPGGAVTSWFALQVVVSLAAAAALAGVERLDRRARGGAR